MNAGSGIIVFGEAKLFARAHHAVGRKAAQLSFLNVDAVGKMRVVQSTGNQRALKDVLCAGDDLDAFLFTDVDLADPELIGVGMMLHLEHFSDYDPIH